MVKEIKYTGFTASPSDYECPDGDLAAVLNVVPEEGSLSPVLPPRQLFQLSDGGDVRFVHETSYIRNFIILHPDNSITWRTEEDPDQYSHGTLSHSFSGHTIHQINAIGNTLIVLADDGMHYFLWKGYRNGSEHEGDEPKEYLYLGTHMPELSLSFGLKIGNWSQQFSGEQHWFDFAAMETSAGEGEEHDWYSDDKNTNLDFISGNSNSKPEIIVNNILADANKLVSRLKKNGYFCMPFLVRYAYRLYDGSTTMQSSPVLMCLPTRCNPLFYLQKIDDELYYVIVRALAAELYYKANSSISELKNWNDIIKSVDIFISDQIYTYEQNEEGEGWLDLQRYNGFTVLGSNTEEYKSAFEGQYVVSGRRISRYSSALNTTFQKRSFYKIALEDHQYLSIATGGSVNKLMNFGHRPSEQINDEIKGVSAFYLLKSFSFDEIKSEMTKIDIGYDYLTTLNTKEVLKDDYDSHDIIIPKYSYGYNGRLNLSDLRKTLFGGFNASSLFAYTEGFEDVDFVDDEEQSECSENNKVYATVFVIINQDNKEFIVDGVVGTFGYKSPFSYFFYPSIYAKKIILSLIHNGQERLYELPLKFHDMLNGSYFFGENDFNLYDGTHDYTGNYPNVTPEKERFIELPNKIYSSEVNNPFYFPVIGISTVGVGRIMAITSATKALSQGQFGQFPLYAFTDEGVWALEVSKTGAISAVQPFTRDVCINQDSITQLDSSVLFATDLGVMLISGSNSICISDNLNYDQVFHIDTLPSSDKLISLAGLTQENFSYVAFREFLLGCRMLYDYVHQRIIVYSRHTDASGHPVSPYPYAYVYSLKTKTWGMIQSNIKDTVPSYPEALAMLFDGSLADYSAEGTLTTDADGNLTGIKGMLITRPLKLDAPDVLKTVDTVIQRGNFQRGHIKTAIYGSRDLIHWFVVWTSVDHYLRGFRGTPYKYFRLVLLCDLDPHESIYGCTVQYTPRFTNRLR